VFLPVPLNIMLSGMIGFISILFRDQCPKINGISDFDNPEFMACRVQFTLHSNEKSDELRLELLIIVRFLWHAGRLLFCGLTQVLSNPSGQFP
jgi:hypothetical protein